MAIALQDLDEIKKIEEKWVKHKSMSELELIGDIENFINQLNDSQKQELRNYINLKLFKNDNVINTGDGLVTLAVAMVAIALSIGDYQSLMMRVIGMILMMACVIFLGVKLYSVYVKKQYKRKTYYQILDFMLNGNNN